ncbi:MAG: GIY-YIG nuclease family protein [Prevotellaceae bacterium]|nr:GIY-YIG nuclease family protein [Candidatus Faecinaster equi]
MTNKKYIVYEHLFPNGKRYIGITSKSPEKRWENGSGYTKDKQPAMHNAIQKYGWDNIEHHILFTDLTFDEASLKEKELIAKFKTNCKRYGDDYGYNMTDGGDGTCGHVVSTESRKLMSEKAMGRNKGVDNHMSTPVICDGKIYESLNDFCVKHTLKDATVRKWLKGECTMPQEWYDKGLKYINEQTNIKRRTQEFIRPLECDGVVFNSQVELARYLDVDKVNLCLWINGIHNPPAHIACKKIKYVDEADYIDFNIQTNGTKKQVIFDGDIYQSQRALAKALNVTPQQLSDWLNKPNKMPQKYIGRIKYVK